MVFSVVGSIGAALPTSCKCGRLGMEVKDLGTEGSAVLPGAVTGRGMLFLSSIFVLHCLAASILPFSPV